MQTVKGNPKTLGDSFEITILGKAYSSRTEGGQAILDACQSLRPEDTVALGSFRGFGLELHYD